MKREYSIGFLSIVIVMFLMIGILYDYSYMKSVEKVKEEKALEADSDLLENECYFLMEVNGYVVVYYGDKKTPFEYTDILFEDLPATTKQEIKNGKYIKDLDELYGFLENYSS